MTKTIKNLLLVLICFFFFYLSSFGLDMYSDKEHSTIGSSIIVFPTLLVFLCIWENINPISEEVKKIA